LRRPTQNLFEYCKSLPQNDRRRHIMTSKL
jgi:hypothetical protein